MGLDKFSKKSDKIANLYRAALFLAIGDKKTAVYFLESIDPFLADEVTTINSVKEQKLLAETILDQFLLRRSRAIVL